MAFQPLYTSQERRICVQQAMDRPRRNLLISGYLREFENNCTHLSTHIPAEIRVIITVYHPLHRAVYHYPDRYQSLESSRPHRPQPLHRSRQNTFSWGKFFMKVTAKTGAKMALNSVVPGSSSMVDFADAANSFYNGNIIGGIVSTGFGVWDLFFLGSGSAVKEAVHEATDDAIVTAGKEYGKDWISEFSKDSAKGYGKDWISAFSKHSAKGYGKDWIAAFSKDSAKGFGQDSFKQLSRDSLMGFGQDSFTEFGRDSFMEFGRDSFMEFGRDSLYEVGRQSFQEAGSTAVQEGAKQATSEAVTTAITILIAMGVIKVAAKHVTKEMLKNALKEAKTPFVKQLIIQAIKDRNDK